MKNFGKGIGGALLSLAFVLGMVVATSGTAQAQYRNDDGYYGRDDNKQDRKDRKREMKRRRKEARRADRRDDGDWRRNRNNGVYRDKGLPRQWRLQRWTLWSQRWLWQQRRLQSG